MESDIQTATQPCPLPLTFKPQPDRFVEKERATSKINVCVFLVTMNIKVYLTNGILLQPLRVDKLLQGKLSEYQRHNYLSNIIEYNWFIIFMSEDCIFF